MVQDLSEALGELTHPPRDQNGAMVTDVDEAPTTVVAVTHNTTLLKHFTHAIMMQQNRVVEYGAIDDLMKRKGHYYRLVMSRTGLSIDAKGNGRCTPERLRQVWVFATAPLESLNALSRRFVTRTMTTDEKLYKKGEDADAMYFLVSGQVEAVEYTEEELENLPQDSADAAKPSDAQQGSTEGDGAFGAEKVAVRRGRRFVYMSGEDFGVEGLLDNNFRWDMTARVASRKAVVLELVQTDLEEVLANDPALAESAGAMLKKVNQLREPVSLSLMWPFHGAPIESLQAVSMAMEAHVAFDGSLLCEEPLDPCQALRIVVSGKVAILRAAAPGGGNSDGQTEFAQSGTSFGDLEMLPLQAPGSIEDLILSKQSRVQRVKAVDFTVYLQLTRAKLTMLMTKDAALGDAFKKNLRLWTDAVRPENLRRSWLLSMLADESVGVLAPAWRISAVPEGHCLVDGNVGSWGGTDTCVVVLEGAVHVRSRRYGLRRGGLLGEERRKSEDQHIDANEVSETVHAGAVINVLSLISTNFDYESAPPEYGEAVWRADVVSETALVLSLPSATFQQMVAQRGGKDVDEMLDGMRKVALARMSLITADGLRSSGAVPKQFTEMHLKQLAQTCSTAVLPEKGSELFGPESGGGAGAAGRRPSLAVPPKVLPHGQTDDADAAPGGTLYFLLSGTLSARTARGEETTLSAGSALCSPLPDNITDLPPKTTVCTAARAASSHCVLLCCDLSSALRDALETHSAEQKAEAERRAAEERQAELDKLKEKCSGLRRDIFEIELRLGLRTQRDPRALWSWAFRRTMTLRAFGQMPAAGDKPPPSADAGGSLEQTLSLLRKRQKELFDVVSEREHRIKNAIGEWAALQPPLLPEEALLDFRPPTELTMQKIAQAEATLTKLTEIREAEREKLLKQLDSIDSAKRADLLRRSKGIDNKSLSLLANALNELSGVLAEPMGKVQSELRNLWEELHMPQPARARYEWVAGMPLDEARLEACKKEVVRLKDTVELVRKLGIQSEGERVLAGEVLNSMLLVMEQERLRMNAEEEERMAKRQELEEARAKQADADFRDTLQNAQKARNMEMREAQLEHRNEEQNLRRSHEQQFKQLKEEREDEKAKLTELLNSSHAQLDIAHEEIRSVRQEMQTGLAAKDAEMVSMQTQLQARMQAELDAKDAELSSVRSQMQAKEKKHEQHVEKSKQLAQTAAAAAAARPSTAEASVQTAEERARRESGYGTSSLPEGSTVGEGGVILDASGKPVVGPDGKPRIVMDPRLPAGGSIGPGGVLLSADGQPVVGNDGKPLTVAVSVEIVPQVPAGGSVGAGGIVLDASGKPVLGPDGKPRTVTDPRLPDGGSIGPGGILFDEDGHPVLGDDGVLAVVDPRVPIGGSIGPLGELLDPAGKPLRGDDGLPLMNGVGVLEVPDDRPIKDRGTAPMRGRLQSIFAGRADVLMATKTMSRGSIGASAPSASPPSPSPRY
jgi:CRP-like cAMP-binding protein